MAFNLSNKLLKTQKNHVRYFLLHPSKTNTIILLQKSDHKNLNRNTYLDKIVQQGSHKHELKVVVTANTKAM